MRYGGSQPYLSCGVQLSDFGGNRISPQDGIHNLGDVRVHRNFAERLNLDKHNECWRGAPFKNRLLRAAAARLFVAQRHRLDTAHKIGKRRVHDDVLKGVTVSGRDQLYSALRNRACRRGFEVRSNLVDNDHFRHMILNRLDHHLVL